MNSSNWHIYAIGRLPTDEMVMMALVRAGYRSKRGFPAVLLHGKQGLWRLRSNRAPQLLSEAGIGQETALRAIETALRPSVPKVWGVQHSSVCVVRQIPSRILEATTSNLARLLLAWFKANHADFVNRCSGVGESAVSSRSMPLSLPCTPVAITLIPSTDVVIEAINSGTLLRRLTNGLERIYVSEMSWIRAPRIEHTLYALQSRFPHRLVLVKGFRFALTAQALRLKRPAATEYQLVGQQLEGQFELDYEYDRFDNPEALHSFIKMRVGPVPRGTKMLTMRQIQVPLEIWRDLDVDGMLNLEKRAKQLRSLRDEKSVRALAEVLAPNSDLL